MAVIDAFPPADLLAGMGWMGLDRKVRLSMIAHSYIGHEQKIESETREYDGPTKRIAMTYLKYYYKPVRGTISMEAEMLVAEIKRQKALREMRKANRPYKHVKLTVAKRRKAFSRKCYRTFRPDYHGKLKPSDTDPVEVGRIGEHITFVADQGGYYAYPRLYLRNNKTGRHKCVVIEAERDIAKTLTSLGMVLMFIGPKLAVRAMFDGKPVVLDFDGEGFVVEGKTLPWRNVAKVYRGPGKSWLKTRAKPKRATKKAS